MDFTKAGKQIRKYRMSLDLKQAQLAEQAGLSTDYISKMERGVRIPKLPNFIRVINALGVTADEILMDVLPKKTYDNRIQEYVERIGKMPDSEQERIFKILEAYLEN
jgi:transcriptional regulator with XRE-family HTH domain